jgi:hypothetical protein
MGWVDEGDLGGDTWAWEMLTSAPTPPALIAIHTGRIVRWPEVAKPSDTASLDNDAATAENELAALRDDSSFPTSLLFVPVMFKQ